ncbi:cytochrome P450 oxidoreductase OrdA-like protein [Xylariaceae sp. FL0594]|nr:cytochrome P450 oxidoreductase OrdA-like protein [Xylariaceae sp. FL0594]
MGLATVRLALLATALVIIVLVKHLTRRRKHGPLPPGPKGFPLVGNVFDLPDGREQEWKHWAKHRDLYGPISSVTTMGTTIVILNDLDLANEMFEKKSSIYSTRAQQTFAGRMVGWENSIALMLYNKTFVQSRKRIHTAVGTLRHQTHRFLLRVLNDPNELQSHIRTEAGAMILEMIYGYAIEPHKADPLVEIMDTVIEELSMAAVPGAWLVDLIPALQHLPSWLPGTGFKKTAEAWHMNLHVAVTRPYEFARRRIANGKSKICYVANCGQNLSDEDDSIVKWTALTLYAGGSDTTGHVLSAFFLAMTLQPEVQVNAQEEIDRVIGSGRLPTLDDMKALPYINAVVKEAFRWHFVLPLGIPHAASEDHVVRGYFIPKGAIVMANIGWFSRDLAVYPDPLRFDPLRYISDSPAPEATDWTFGFGRRICPGRYLALNSVWLTIARALAVFEIGKGVDELGREMEPVVNPTTGTVSRPGPYQASIKPRSALHEALIRQAETLYPWEPSESHELRDIVV